MKQRETAKVTSELQLKDSYKQYTTEHSDVIKDYFLPYVDNINLYRQVREFEDMHYINR